MGHAKRVSKDGGYITGGMLGLCAHGKACMSPEIPTMVDAPDAKPVLAEDRLHLARIPIVGHVAPARQRRSLVQRAPRRGVMLR